MVTYSLLLLEDGGALSASLLLALALLEQGLGDHDLVLGRDSSIRIRLVRSPAYRVRGMEQKSADARTVACATFCALADSS